MERIHTLSRKLDITTVSILFLSLSQQILLAIIGFFGGGGGPASYGSFPPKEKGVLKKWLNKPADALKRLTGNTVVGAIVIFLGKTDEFVVDHTYALIIFAADIVGVLLMQKLKK